MNNKFNLIVGQEIKVHGYKHDGTLYREWNNYFVKQISNDYIILEGKDVFVREDNGDFWKHKGITYWYLSKTEWFNCINFYSINKNEWYCNIASPFYYDGEVVKFIDYDIDIKLENNGKFHIRDFNEFKRNAVLYNYSEKLCDVIQMYTNILIDDIKSKSNIFSLNFLK